MVARLYDPLLCDFPLPLKSEYFPMGHALEIATNSAEVLKAAARIWSRFPRLSQQPAVRLTIAIDPQGASCSTNPPIPRGREHLFSIVHDSGNWAFADLAAGFGFACLAGGTVSDSAYLRYHFLEPLVYVMLTARYFTLAHASCVSLDGRAVLLCGDSGAGKTCLAFECVRRGWTFLSGDATAMVRGRKDYSVIGRPFEVRFRDTAQALFPELEPYKSVLRPGCKFDIEADPRDLNLVSTVEGQASHIVFLDRASEPVQPSLQLFRRDEAERRLEQAICYGDEASRSDQRDTLLRFLNLPILKMRYSNLAAAERVLRTLAQAS